MDGDGWGIFEGKFEGGWKEIGREWLTVILWIYWLQEGEVAIIS
jgi:hypothetical protein